MQYTTRVELHRASGDDYENLHAAMLRQGFSRKIQSDDGTWYHLPTAEYNYEGPAALQQVLAAAETAATTTERAFGLLVTESKARMWKGLPRA
jgi:hypothetical protein